MVTVWWSAAGLIHYSLLNPGEIMTSKKYAQIVDEMHRKLQCQQLALVNRKKPYSSPWQCPAAYHTTNTSKAVINWAPQVSPVPPPVPVTEHNFLSAANSISLDVLLQERWYHWLLREHSHHLEDGNWKIALMNPCTGAYDPNHRAMQILN
ncbi:Histone-lysine N-methyltransferase SETMAR [Plecturocebus cupreus]